MLHRLLASFVFVCLSFINVSVAAASASDDLVSQLGNLKSFRAQFVQTTFDESGAAIQKMQGEIAAQKPGKLYWSAKPPFEQLLVSDGKTIWHYDRDLEQVTEKPFSERYGDTPAVILSGDSKALHNDYDITLINANDGKRQLFKLIPHDRKKKMFDSMEVIIEGGKIIGLSVVDNLQQKTEMTFSNIVANGAVDASLFQFSVPKGVDVIREQ